MRVAVIDDERPARSELTHQLLALLPEAVVEEGESGARALEMAGEKQYDLFFLDINLGDIQGTVLVNALRNMQPGAKIVFVTAYTEYAVKAFELGVEDYILKPYDRKRLEKVLNKCGFTGGEKIKTGEKHIAGHAAGRDAAGARNKAGEVLKRIAINTGGRMVFVEVQDIVYVETHNRGCLIHAAGEEYFEGKSIGEFERRLENMGFFRSQKSYLINISKVKELFLWGNNSFAVKMEGYDENILPVGREKIKTLRQLLGTG